MGAWDDIIGQADAVALLTAASRDPQAMTHAWLITGPPGSGRSNIAYAFAKALLSRQPGGDEHTDQQVDARTHPDLTSLATSKVIISIDEVRHLVTGASYAPSVGRYRVIVVEDADRMAERTSNVLLKALEEPPERTVWILCAPSEADLIPTIRSRVRSVRLRVPAVDEVAELLQRRDGVDHATAERAARHAQNHIGMAHRLATDEEARARREHTLTVALSVRTVSDAVLGAGTLLELAGSDASAYTEQRDAEEREHTLRSLGVEAGKPVPPALRSQIRTLEEEQKRRATRSLRDGLDRILVDLQSLYRDIALLQFGLEDGIINRELLPRLRESAASSSQAATMATLDAIATARQRIEGNVAPTLALEAMLVAAQR